MPPLSTSTDGTAKRLEPARQQLPWVTESSAFGEMPFRETTFLEGTDQFSPASRPPLRPPCPACFAGGLPFRHRSDPRGCLLQSCPPGDRGHSKHSRPRDLAIRGPGRCCRLEAQRVCARTRAVWPQVETTGGFAGNAGPPLEVQASRQTIGSRRSTACDRPCV